MSERPRPPVPYDYLPAVPAFTLASSDIAEGQALSHDHVHHSVGTPGGGNLSPHLRWSGFPTETQGFAVTCFDPDAPTGSGWWHWVLFNLPASVTELPRGAGSGSMAGLPAGAVHARNDYGTRDFGGAAPPAGDPPHRYVFAVHALHTAPLGPDADASPAVVGFHLTFHTIARATLTPIFGH